MTALGMIAAARKVRVMFGLCNVPGDVMINVSKAEARRIIREHGLPHDEVGYVYLSDGTASIIFHT